MAYAQFRTANGSAVVTGPPGTPTGLTAVANGRSRIDLTWLLAGGFPQEKGVRLERGTDGVNFAQLVDLSRDTESYSDVDLSPGVEYFYRVLALGNVIASDPSNVDSATTAADDPPVASFVPEATTVTAGSSIHFADTSTGEIFTWEWRVNGTLVSNLASPVILFATAGISAVTLTVIGPGGTSTTAPPVNITATEVTLTPTIQSIAVADQGTGSRWTFNFNATVTGHTGFDPRDGDGFILDEVYVSGEGTTSLVFDALPVYQGDTLAADYLFGDVNHSGIPLGAFTGFPVTNLSTRQRPAPVPPSGVSASVTGKTLTISFAAAVAGLANVSRRHLNEFGKHGFKIASAVSPDGLRIDKYVGGSGTASLQFLLNRIPTAGEVLSLRYAPGYVVSAVGGDPLLPFAGLSVTNGNTGVADPATPAAPIVGACAPSDDYGVFIAWALADARDTQVQVRWGLAGSGVWKTLPTMPGGTFCLNFLYALSPATFYDFQVRAGNASGWSGWSPTFTGSTTASGANAKIDCTLTAVSATVLTNQSVRLAWTNPSTGSAKVYICRSDDGGASYRLIKAVVMSPASGPQGYTDTQLTPGVQYRYRIQVGTSGGDYGPFGDVTATTTNTAGVPLAPEISHYVKSTTQTVVTIVDKTGGLYPHLVETAPIPSSGGPDNATYTQVGIIPAGQQQYVLATVAKTPKLIRIRADNSGTRSIYAGFGTEYNEDRHIVRPPSGATGTLTVTPETYLDLSMQILTSERVEFTSGTYPYKALWAGRGLADKPLLYTKAAGATVVFDGVGHVCPPGYVVDGKNGSDNSDRFDFSDVSLGLVAKLSSDPRGYQPGHFRVEGITFQRISIDEPGAGQYTAWNGTTRTIARAAAGQYVGGGDNITFKRNVYRRNGNGFFAANTGAINRDVSWIVSEENNHDENGVVNSDRQHHVYSEARGGIIYVGNWFGNLRPTAKGVQGIKDRSSGTIIKCNGLLGAGGRKVDCIEGDASQVWAVSAPGYNRTDIWGNLVDCIDSATPFNYGYDQSQRLSGRRGTLRFYGNTLFHYKNKVSVGGSTSQYRVVWFKMNNSSNPVAAVNNVFQTDKGTPDGLFPETVLYSVGGANGAFLNNFMPPGWMQLSSGAVNTGMAFGSETFISPANRLPEFVDPTSDRRVLKGSPSANAGSRLPMDCHTQDEEYTFPLGTQPRASYGAGSDLGYAGGADDLTAPTVIGTPTVNELGNKLSLNVSEASTGGAGFVFKVNGSPVAIAKNASDSTSTLFVYDIAVAALAGQETKVSYAAGNVADLAGNPMADFADRTVDNQSNVVSAFIPVIAATNYGWVPAATSFTLAPPVGTVPGSPLLVECVNASAGVNGSTTGSTGWTKIIDVQAGGGASRLTVWKRIADGGANDTFTATNTLQHTWSGGVIRFTGADPSNFATVFTTAFQSSGTTPTCPAAVAAVANCGILRLLSVDGSFTQPPSPNVPVWSTGGPGAAAHAGASYRGQAAAGDTGTVAFSLPGSNQTATATIVINPMPM